MRLSRPQGFRTLPYDGLVRLGPGELCNIQHKSLPHPSHDDALATMLSARADILARMFAVENELILLILADRFSTLEPLLGGPIYLLEEAKLRKMTLGAHVREAIKILEREHPELDSLVSDLKHALTVRNVLARRPCWLSPVNTSEGFTVSFVAMIADDKSMWLVDDKQIGEWVLLVIRCLAVRAVASTMLERREQPSFKHDLGSWPLGLRIPPGDPLGHHSPLEVIAQASGVPFRTQSWE